MTKEIVLTVSKSVIKQVLPLVSIGLSYYLQNQKITSEVNKQVCEALGRYCDIEALQNMKS